MSTVLTSAESGVSKTLDKLNSILIPGETVEAWAIQSRVFALSHRRIFVAATSGRFIALLRPLLGGFDPVDLRWQDLKEAKIKVGLFGADLILTVYDSADLAIAEGVSRTLIYPGLRTHDAQDVYRVCQAHEQSWREKRRVRELEELRARAGGVQISGAQNAGSAGETNGEDSVQRLQRAKQMLDAKLISDSEYEAIKARIINTV
jgi:hypothetical protein